MLVHIALSIDGTYVDTMAGFEFEAANKEQKALGFWWTLPELNLGSNGNCSMKKRGDG
jgi:hypothetical protein